MKRFYFQVTLAFLFSISFSISLLAQISFVEDVSVPFDGVHYSSIAFADIDGDGDQDVLITGWTSTYQPTSKLYTNNGSGSYTLVSGTSLEAVGASSVAFADIDGDGDQDVLITGLDSTSQTTSKLYTNNGSGSFTLVTGTPFDQVYVGSIAFADIDGDGDQDVLITGVNGLGQRISKLYTNDGSGGFTLVTGTPFDGVWRSSVAFADIDGDGDQDLLITGVNSSTQSISKLYNNNGSGGFTLVTGTPFDGVKEGSIAFADINADGDQDVLITGRNSSYQSISQLYTNDGSGGFTLVTGTPFDGVDRSSVAFADIYSDGYQDVLITGINNSGQFISKLYSNNGTGSYALVTGMPFDGVWLSSVAFTDIDGDNDQDVLVTGALNFSYDAISKLYINESIPPCNLTSVTANITDASCTNTDDGEAQITINFSSAPVAIEGSLDAGANWIPLGTPGSNPFAFPIGNLAAGSYSITIREVADTSCEIVTPFTIGVQANTTDSDGDGVSVEDCDCDDNDDTVFPGADELCDGIDNNCDGDIDENALPDAYLASLSGTDVTLIPAFDTNTFNYTASVCNTITETIISATASNTLPATNVSGDGYASLNEGLNTITITVEACGTTQDYNIDITRLAAVIYYADTDNDGFGNANDAGTPLCSLQAGYATNNQDCDDTNDTVYPGAPEINCDGLDNDCNPATPDNNNPVNVNFAVTNVTYGPVTPLEYGVDFVDGVDYTFASAGNNPGEVGGNTWEFTNLIPSNYGGLWFTFNNIENPRHSSQGPTGSMVFQSFDTNTGVATFYSTAPLTWTNPQNGQPQSVNTQFRMQVQPVGATGTSPMSAGVVGSIPNNIVNGGEAGLPGLGLDWSTLDVSQQGDFQVWFAFEVQGTNQSLTQYYNNASTPPNTTFFTSVYSGFYAADDICVNPGNELTMTAVADGNNTAPFIYTFNDITNATGVFPGIAAGTFNYSVLAANGCLTNGTHTVGAPDLSFLVPVPDVATLPAINAECEVTSLTAPTVTDICDGSLTGVSDASLPITVQGTTVVTWSYTNSENNTVTQTQDVIIADVTPPTVSCSDAFLETDIGECTITIQDDSLDATFSDNCNTAFFENDYNNSLSLSGAVFDVGQTTVTWTATDDNGNVTTCIQQVEVSIMDPIINTITPDTFYPGDIVVIQGSNFTNLNNQVTVGGIQAYPSSESATEITITIPSEVCPGDIQVTNGCALVSNLMPYNLSPTFIDSIYPPSIPTSGGVAMDIMGIFSETGNTVTIGGQNINIVSETQGLIGIEVPEYVCGDELVVINACGIPSMPIPLVADPPAISAINPIIITPSNNLTIDGVNFVNGNNVVTINGVVASIISESLNQIIVEVPFLNNTCDAIINLQTCGVQSNNITATAIELTPPSISCLSNINAIATSAAGAVVTYTEPIGTDNCSGATTLLTSSLGSGDTFPIGDTTVTYQVTDSSGNTADCSFTVSVVGVAPVIVCPNDITQDTDAGLCSAVVNFAVTDAIGIPESTITYSQDPGTVFPLGTTVVTATATNAVGTTTCTFNVIVEDNEAPTAVCQDVTVYLDANGEASITAQDIDNGSSDVCGAVTLSIDQTTFDCSDIGASSTPSTNLFISEYIEGGGNNKCIEIYNGTGAAIDLAVGNYILKRYSNGSTVGVILPLTGVIADGDVHVICNPSSTSDFLNQSDQVSSEVNFNGDDAVTLVQGATVIDIFGTVGQDPGSYWSSASNQTQNRTLVRKSDITTGVITNPIGFPTLEAEWTEFPQDNFANLGSHTVSGGGSSPMVTLTVTDSNGNVSTCEAAVTVLDTIFPEIVCPSNIDAIATSAAGAEVTYTEPIGTDNCSGVTTMLTSSLGSGDTFPIGDTTVTYQVTDSSGNTADCSFTVSVVGVAPVIVCPNDITQNTDAGLCSAVVTFEATDAIGIPESTITYSQDPGTVFPLGTTVVTATATNAVGTSTCTFNVTVVDNEAPSVSCNNITVALDATGNYTLTQADIDAIGLGSSDACGAVTFSVDTTQFSCSDVGSGGNVTPSVWINEFHYDDASGDDGEFVEVAGTAGFDLTGYTIVLYNGSNNESYNTINLSGSIDDEGSGYGAQSFLQSGIQNGGPDGLALVDDNGGVVEFLSYEGSFTASNGPASGLTSTDVGVAETGSTLEGNSLQRTSDGSSNIWVGPDAESPGNLNAGQSLSSGGGVQVTLTVTDSNNNTSTCTATITVEDNTAPSVVCNDITVELDATGNYTLTQADIDAIGFGSSDACGAVTYSVDTTQFSCSDVGSGGNATPSVWINEFHYDDASGDDGEFVEVAGTAGFDLTGYTIVLYNGSNNESYNTINLSGSIDDEGSGYGAQSFLQSGIQNGGPDGLALVDNNGGVVEFLSYEGSFTASNGPASGLTSTDVGVEETGSTLEGNSLQRTSDGSLNVWVGPDAESPGSLNAGQNFSSGGGVEVTLTVTDSNGNTATCTATITVEDNVAPTVVCNDITVQLDATGNYTLTQADIDAIGLGSSDACGTVTFSVDTTQFSCSDVGSGGNATPSVWINEFHYDDVSGDNGEFVEVAGTAGFDLTGYTIVLYNGSNNESYNTINLSGSIDDEGSGYGAQSFLQAGIQNGGPDGLALVDNNGGVVEFLSYEGAFTASNGPASGLTSTDVGVAETGSTLEGNSLQRTSDGSLNVWVGPDAESPGNLNAGQNFSSGGGVEVTLTVTDSNGNTATCTATITVEDNTAPSVVCNNITVALDETGNYTLTQADLEAIGLGSSDTCGAVTFSVDNDTFDCSDIGQTNTVTLTVTDSHSNSATCTATITVEDNVAPTVVCNDITVELDATGNYTLTQADIDAIGLGSSDACGAVTFAVDNTQFSCSDVSSSSPTFTDLIISEYVEGSGFNKYIEIYNGTGSDVDLSVYSIDTYFNGSTTIGSSSGLNGILTDGSTLVFGNTSGTIYNGALAFAANWNGDDAIVLRKQVQNNSVILDVFGHVGEDPGSYWSAGSNRTQNRTLVRNANITSGNTDDIAGFPSLGTEWTEYAEDTASYLGNHTVSSGGGVEVTLTVTDSNNNTATCTATITVEDNISPVITCVGNGTRDTDSGSCDYTIQGTEFDATFTDNCTAGSISNSVNGTSSLAGEVFALGATTVTWTADDGHGQVVTCTTTITVEDNEDPVIACLANATRDTDPGDCDYTIQGTEFDATFADNCTVGSISNSINGTSSLAGEVFVQGSTTVTWTADDGHGQVVTCTTTITVEDNEAPTVSCLDLQIQLDAFGNGSIQLSDIDGNSTDNCGIASVTLSQLTFDCTDIGGDLDKLIISEYIDGSGNEDCIEIFNGTGNPIDLYAEGYTLNVYLDGSPTVTYSVPLLGVIGDREVYVVCNPSSPAAASEADQTGAFAFDGNDAISLADTNNPVDIIGEIGVNPGTGWSATSTSTYATTLVRNEDVLQGRVNAFVANMDSEWTQYAQNTVSQLGDHTIDITDLANNVILTVTDTSGNVSTCEGNVTVVDGTAPIARCQNVVVQLDADGNGFTTAQAVDNGSEDACGIASLTLDNSNFTCADIGENTVTLTVTDNNGNTATCTAIVTVEDYVAPTVETQDIIVQLDANGNASIIADDVDNGSDDACGVATTSVSPNTFDCTNVGANTVTLTVTDVNGNVATDTAIVTIEDNVNPIAVCENITVQLDAFGTVSITGEDVDGGSTDNCGSVTYSVSPSTFDCSNEGDNSVTLTVTDAYGNIDTCTAIVTVEGDFPDVSISQGELPEFCQGAALVLTANSDLAVSYEWVNTNSPLIVIGTEQELQVSENGTYGVTVTSATSCTAYIEHTVSGFDAGSLMSSYTILATNEVFLHGGNLVQSGGVGAMNPNSGNIKLHQASNVVGFAQAVNITLNQGSTVGTPIYAAANPTIPAFQFNTQSNSGSPNVTISNNTSQTLNGAVYGTVTVRSGATVTFSQPNVYIDELKTFSNATIEFSDCANVYINDKFMLAAYGTINSNGNNVVFYVNEDVQIEKGSNVRARIHSNGNELLVKGENGNGNNAGEPTYMTGMFIANRVHGSKNVIWNADNLCSPCPVELPIVGGTNPNENEEARVSIEVVAWPNPSDTVFNLRLKTENLIDQAEVNIFDINNKLVHKGDFHPEDVYKFGNEFDGGVYIVKVTQAGIDVYTRVVKF